MASLADLLQKLAAGPRARVREALGGLQPRERMLVYLGAGVSLVLVLWLGVWDPLMAEIGRLDAQIARARDDSAEIQRLVARHGDLLRQVEKLERRASDVEGGSLFAQLESITVPMVGRERIVSMNPSARPVGESFEEEIVDLRLDGVPSRELVQLLYDIEDGQPPMYVKRAAFKRQYKDPARLDATLVVARLRPQ